MTERRLGEPPVQSYLDLCNLLGQYGTEGKLDGKNPDGSYQFTLQIHYRVLHFQFFHPEKSSVEYWEVVGSGPRRLTVRTRYHSEKSGLARETRVIYSIKELDPEYAQRFRYRLDERVQEIKRIIRLNLLRSLPTPR